MSVTEVPEDEYHTIAVILGMILAILLLVATPLLFIYITRARRRRDNQVSQPQPPEPSVTPFFIPRPQLIQWRKNPALTGYPPTGGVMPHVLTPQDSIIPAPAHTQPVVSIYMYLNSGLLMSKTLEELITLNLLYYVRNSVIHC